MKINFDGDEGVEVTFARPGIGPVKIFDAAGVEYHMVLNCDTETGLIERTGDVCLRSDGARILKELLSAPAPLRVVFEKNPFVTSEEVNDG